MTLDLTRAEADEARRTLLGGVLTRLDGSGEGRRNQ